MSISTQTSCTSKTLLGLICHLKCTTLKECAHKPPFKTGFLSCLVCFPIRLIFQIKLEGLLSSTLLLYVTESQGLLWYLAEKLLDNIVIEYTTVVVMFYQKTQCTHLNIIIILLSTATSLNQGLTQSLLLYCKGLMICILPNFTFSLPDSPTCSANIFQLLFSLKFYIHYAAPLLTT